MCVMIYYTVWLNLYVGYKCHKSSGKQLLVDSQSEQFSLSYPDNICDALPDCQVNYDFDHIYFTIIMGAFIIVLFPMFVNPLIVNLLLFTSTHMRHYGIGTSHF